MKIKVKATSRLRDIRNELSLNQDDMSHYIGTILGRSISKSMYQKIEQGTTTISSLDALTISRAVKENYEALWVKR